MGCQARFVFGHIQRCKNGHFCEDALCYGGIESSFIKRLILSVCVSGIEKGVGVGPSSSLSLFLD